MSWVLHGQYDEVVIKDVLEHCTKKQLPKMLNNMSKLSNRMMCVVPLGDNGKYRIREYHVEISHQIIEDEDTLKIHLRLSIA